MALHPNFPSDPHAILDPAIRWFPADEALRETTMDKLMPPLVAELRERVQAWRKTGYEGATDTSRSLLGWWFETPHLLERADGSTEPFQYFFAQREALETIVYLHDVVRAKDKFDLMRFDRSGLVTAKHFDEDWPRYVVKMATGAGKTKVLSLVLAWSFYHKRYEADSDLARNFLVIAPNIIVFDRIKKDFAGLRIFFADPVVPDNGYDGRNWRDDFQLTVHLQDDVRAARALGNIYLTNIHRVYAGNEVLPSADDENTMDYFLGPRPSGKTTDSKTDLGMIVRELDELVVLNDEAHHIHEKSLAWFQSIADIDNRLRQKDARLALQIDVTATPRHNNGGIFVQTVADYPLVEAIAQNVVKHPVLPDAPSRAKLQERQSVKFTERYADYLDLGVIEWRKAYELHEKRGKKAILFVMTDDTKNCDDVAAFLEGKYPELQGAVLTIHTNKSGEVTEATSGKSKEELDRLRSEANHIDGWESPHKAIVSVMMLKEGWDVRNVTTIVGLRAYAAKSNILPEQTLGRGLRKMYPGREEEYVSVMGTPAFMEFVESIQAEGVVLEQRAMGEGGGNESVLVEVETENPQKNLDALDIEIPVLTPRAYREYKNLDELDATQMTVQPVEYKQFSAEEQREIVFKDISTGEVTHTTQLDGAGIADYRSVLAYFARQIMKDMRLISGYDAIYGRVKEFVRERLFGHTVDLEDANTLRNLSELAASKTLQEAFHKAINALTVRDQGNAEVRGTIKLRDTRPFVAGQQAYVVPKKSVFNKIIGDSGFELRFAAFLEACDDVASFGKNLLAVGFKLDYVTESGDIGQYIPDFFVKATDGRVFIVETKGQRDWETPNKLERLRQWCEDVNRAQSEQSFDFVFVDEESFEKFKPASFRALVEGFREFKSQSV